MNLRLRSSFLDGTRVVKYLVLVCKCQIPMCSRPSLAVRTNPDGDMFPSIKSCFCQMKTRVLRCACFFLSTFPGLSTPHVLVLRHDARRNGYLSQTRFPRRDRSLNRDGGGYRNGGGGRGREASPEVQNGGGRWKPRGDSDRSESRSTT